MLLEISIKNFALIKQLNIDFRSGFNVLMGETGAGKSNIIDALGVLMGGRASRDKINKDSDNAYISAAFDVYKNENLTNYLSTVGINLDEEPLIITRELNRKSGTVSKINNNIVSAAVLRELSVFLIDIYGQFDNMLILSKNEQRNFIDNLGDSNHRVHLTRYKEQFKRYQALQAELESMTKSPEDIARMSHILNFQINEIEASKVLELDEESIESRLNILENMQNLMEITEESSNLLDGENEENIIMLMNKLEHNAAKITQIDSKYAELEGRIKQIYIDLKDIRFEVSNYFNELSFDEEELYKLDKIRSDIFSMKRKYGRTIEEIASFYDNSKRELKNISEYETKIESLKHEIEIQIKVLRDLAYNISKSRKVIIDNLEQDIKNEFIELEMNNAKFHVEMQETELNSSGMDDIVFMVSFNKDQPLKEFSSVASGGEISRFMLAIKSIEVDFDKIPTIIFDEIDSGISGNAGKVVAKKLKKLSKNHQLIAISHLPQIISRADSQYLVYKNERSNGVESGIKLLDRDERIIELAKVIEGNDYNENTLLTANKMIEDGSLGE